MQKLLMAFALVGGMMIGTLMSQSQWLTDRAEASHEDVTTNCVGANTNDTGNLDQFFVAALTNTSNNNRNANVVVRDKNGDPLFNDNDLEIGNFNTEYVTLRPPGNNNAAWVKVRARSSIKVAAHSAHASSGGQNDNFKLQCYT